MESDSFTTFMFDNEFDNPPLSVNMLETPAIQPIIQKPRCCIVCEKPGDLFAGELETLKNFGNYTTKFRISCWVCRPCVVKEWNIAGGATFRQ